MEPPMGARCDPKPQQPPKRANEEPLWGGWEKGRKWGRRCGERCGGGGGTCGADTYGEMALVGLELWGGQLWGCHCRDGTMGMELWGWN